MLHPPVLVPAAGPVLSPAVPAGPAAGAQFVPGQGGQAAEQVPHRLSRLYSLYIILFFYFRLNFRHAARLRHRSRPAGRGSGAGFILFGSPHTGQIAQQVVQHSGGKPVLGVKIIAFAQRDIRQVLFLDGPQCRTAAGGFLHAAVAQALQDGIHLAVCYTIPDAAFGLLMA